MEFQRIPFVIRPVNVSVNQSINQCHFPALGLGMFQDFLYGFTSSLPVASHM